MFWKTINVEEKYEIYLKLSEHGFLGAFIFKRNSNK